ncbi:hypothetical protein C3L33_16415, partial [Rhododendron williamsianum]
MEAEEEEGVGPLVVWTHRHKGVFITWGKEDALCTKNLVPGEAVYNEKRVSVQARILALNASYFLKTGGNFIISIKANCIDSTEPASAVFAQEVKKLQADHFKPIEQVTLEPFERDHACVNRCLPCG